MDKSGVGMVLVIENRNITQIVNYTKNDLKVLTKLNMFLLFFPANYLENVIVKATRQTLVEQALSPLTMGEFLRFLGCIFFMSRFSGVDRRDFFSPEPISMATGAPYRLTQFMAGYRFQQIMSCICITTSKPTETDRFWEVRNLITAWNKNMQDWYVPSWVSCLEMNRCLYGT
jgi:hypothetical protein